MSLIVDELKQFLSGRESFLPSAEDKARTYTASPEYLITTTYFHSDLDTKAFTDAIVDPSGTRYIDVGCCSGFTGLTLALAGYRVAFHDFEGLGLQFIRMFGEKHRLAIEVIPYGQELTTQYDVAIALDVLEHTGNHLAFIKWISYLAGRVIVTYPLMQFAPPYEAVIDEWVDDRAIVDIVKSRYHLLHERIGSNNARRFLIWTT